MPMALGGSVTFSGQLLLVWPVLYASAALPGWAAWLTALTSVLAYGYVVVEADNASGSAWLTTAIWLVGTTLVGVALRRRTDLFAAALRRQAMTDALTGLANRRAMQGYFAHVTEHGAGPDDDLAVLVLDVDHFKLINDRNGHVAGDQTLERLGHLIASHVRADDFAARIGGEEFAVVIPGCGMPSAGERAEDLRSAVERVSRASWPYPVTVSIGVAVARTRGKGAAELLTAADAALYQAKESGRNTVRRAPSVSDTE
jgi:diguanylate cyclase (GGDEF)-like protein